MQTTHERREDGASAGPTVIGPLTTAPDVVRRGESTGPRTAGGKEQSKRNALKHGIFSTVALLPGESRTEFDSLLEGLRSDLQPEGALETVLVEKLAVLSWRYRRLIIAEGAEIQRGAALFEWVEKERQETEASESSDDDELNPLARIVGLMTKKGNPQILERCLELLEDLKDYIEQDGLDCDFDEEILKKIYGNRKQFTNNLLDTYRSCSQAAYDEEEGREDDQRSRQYAKAFLKELKREIARLEQYKKARAEFEAKRARLESLRQRVPESPDVDRLLRYEVSIDRAFDRTLTQLERLQRMRLGQSVTPPIKVDISSS